MNSKNTMSGNQHWKLLKRGAYRQKSAIWALVYKEYKIKLGKSRIGLFWVLVEPIVGMLMISAIWLATGRTQIEHVDVMLFIGSGFIVFSTVRQGINYIPHAISANQALLNYPQVKPIDTIFARFIQGMWLHSLASLLMLSLLWWLLGIKPQFPDPLLCIQTIAIAMLLALGLAMPIAVYGTLYEGILKFISLITQPLMILSGVMYSMNELPATATKILAWNPIVHLVDAFRQGAFGTRPFDGQSLMYPFLFGLFLFGTGFVFYHINRFRLLQT